MHEASQQNQSSDRSKLGEQQKRDISCHYPQHPESPRADLSLMNGEKASVVQTTISSTEESPYDGSQQQFEEFEEGEFDDVSSLSDQSSSIVPENSDFDGDVDDEEEEDDSTTSSLSDSYTSYDEENEEEESSYVDESDSEATDELGIPRELELTENEVNNLANLMTSNQASDIARSFAERASMLSSINWLAHHVPICVLNQLGDEVKTGMESSTKTLDTDDSPLTLSNINGSNGTLKRRSGSSGADSGETSDTDSIDIHHLPQHEKPKNRRRQRLAWRRSSLHGDGPYLNGSSRRPLHDSFEDAQLTLKRHTSVPVKMNESIGSLDSSSERRVMRASREFGASLSDIASISTRDESDLEQKLNSVELDRATTRSLDRALRSVLKPEATPTGQERLSGSTNTFGSDKTLTLARRALGIGMSKRPVSYRDPFPFDSDEEKPPSNTFVPAQRRMTIASTLSRGRRAGTIPRIRSKKAPGTEESYLLPRAESHQSALLFVDISGFTKLSTTLDPESLSKAINSYFQRIVNEATALGGDILKFAGDAVFVEWKAAPLIKPNSNRDLIWSQQQSLTDCVHTAATCAARLVAKCSDFPIFAHSALGPGARTHQGHPVATLNVHCGLGCGEIVGVHVGDYGCRREFVILGDPIDQVAEAVETAEMGEVAISPQALTTLMKTCHIDSGHNGRRPLVIAQRSICHFRAKNKRKSFAPRSDNVALSQRIESWHVSELQKYHKLISLYAHPVVVNNDASAAHKASVTTQERHREEAELRDVYVMFISPLISTRVTGNPEADRQLYRLLNSIINLTTRELNRFNGHLRQFIVDDKGLVLIATFGLRGSTCPNMVAERALPATINIHNALQTELSVQNQIGATTGKAYCGVVGGLKRHEFAVLGPSVNLAARLMASPKNPGILVDDAVRQMADRSYAFNALPPVKAKGYTALVPIFEPLSPLERRWGRVQPNFVGRKQEIMSLMRTSREMALTVCRSKMMFISGDIGIGKSCMVVHAIEHVRKLLSASRRKLIVTKHVSKESDKLVPFGIFRSILIDVMGHFRSSSSDDKSVASFKSGGMDSIGWESLSGASFAPSKASALTRSGDRLELICRELSAPPAFHELVGHHLLGMEGKGVKERPSRRNSTNMKSLVNFMARAFLRCTQDSSLVILALDDVHHMDEMSWRVVQNLFETSTNILFICTSRPLDNYKLAIQKSFWEDLNGMHSEEERFKAFTLQRLEEADIKSMIAKTLGLQESDVSPSMIRDVFMQSGGLPSFANEILESTKRVCGTGSQIARRGVEDEEETSLLSVAELLLHRIDAFDASVRNALNIGAILGNSFDLREVVAVLQEMAGDEEEPKLVEKTRAALDSAVTEAILYVTHTDEEPSDDPFGDSLGNFSDSLSVASDGELGALQVLTYSFCHDIWRSTILNLMLDSRKRDMHKTIALTLKRQHGTDADDYLSRMKLFSHWKASGATMEAASLALCIGKSFEELGLQDQSIKLYEDALDMWRGNDNRLADKSLGGFSQNDLVSLSATDVENVVKIYIALGKCLSNIHKATEGVQAYQQALNVLRYAQSASELKDRSIVFPIFSGLFVAVKFGQIEQDAECTYEQTLVARFVLEARLHGDPVHYTRALAMQAEMYGRLGKFEKAFVAHNELASIYDPDEHSTAISEHFGSDRSAQSFSMSAMWHFAQGSNEEALEMCWYVLNELIPKMDIRNVHNTTIMLYPLLWILKDNGYALEAREHFIRLVVDPFDQFFGDGRSTFCLPVYEPIMILLDMAGNPDSITEEFDEYVDWALEEENLRFGTVINCCLGNFGTAADSITAEICLCLARHMNQCEEKAELVLKGIQLGHEMVALTESHRMLQARRQIEPILQELEEMAEELSIVTAPTESSSPTTSSTR